MPINPVQAQPNAANHLWDMLKQGSQQGADAVNQADKQQADLQQMIQGKQMDAANQTAGRQQEYDLGQQGKGADQQRNMQGLQDLNDKGLIPDGGGAKVGDVGVTKGYNPNALANVGAKQGQNFLKTAQGAYKPINDQLDASKSTIDALNQGNATSDKLALINEARLAAGQGGSRAIGQMVATLSGDPTMAGDIQKAQNWLQGTPNIPSMTPAMRDSLRESVFNRLGQLDQQHKQIQSQLGQQGPVVAPGSDYNTIIRSLADPASQRLQQLQGMQADYQKQRQAQQAQGNKAISAPSVASPNPTMLDRLKGLFGGGSQQAAPPAAPQTKNVGGKTYVKTQQGWEEQ